MSAYPDSPPQAPAIGAAPPHSLEAERSVLGAILLSDRTLYALVIDEGLQPEDFYRERHAVIYRAILDLYGENEPIDVLTVTEHLRSSGQLEEAGGAAAVDELAAAVPAAGNARRYAQIVREHALMRRLLQTTYSIQSQVLNNEALPREIVEQAERAMFEVAHDERTKDFQHIGGVLDREVRIWQDLSTGKQSLTGTPSGFADLDEITGGFQPGNLIIIAARPSMGKCLRGSTLVHDPLTGARRRLDEVVAAQEAGEEVWVTAMGPDLRLRPAKVSASFRNGVKPLLRVTTRLGRHVEGTANHPLLTLDGWKQIDELAPGARIAVPRRLPTISEEAWPAATGSGGRADVTKALGHPHERVATATAARGQEHHQATSDLWWDEIAAIEPIGEEETFDLTVPVHHNFVANDVIVHNSALVTNIAENVALHKTEPRPVALFSLEMSESELAMRFIASRAKIKGDDLRKGRLKEERKWKLVLDAAEEYERSPLHLDDSSDISLLEIRAKARRLHSQMKSKYGGLGMVVVDYLQLLRPDGRVESRVEQVGQMSRGLKILARELEVPVIALSQLSRGVESRTDKRPLLSDLRECVTGDTLVCLSDGRRVPISELEGTTPEVLALDDFDRVISSRSDCVWKVGRRPVFNVRLASGRSLRCTAEHRIRTWDGWEKAGTVKAGTRVALARHIPEPASPERWPDDRVVLLGQLVGDGSYLSGQPMRYCTSSEENSRAVTEAAEREFGARVTRYAGRGSWHQLLISGNGNRWHPAGVNAWLRELGIFGQRSHEKRIPEAAFRLPNDQVALLLSHLWATDGCIHVSRRQNGRLVTRVFYATNSPGLASDVAALLSRLGIVARITTHRSRDEHRPMLNVVVSGAEEQKRFLATVAPYGPRIGDAAALQTALADVKANTNVDTLPVEVWEDVKEVMTAGGITPRQMAALRGTAYGGSAHFSFSPTRATIADYATRLDSEDLAVLIEDDLFWDRVIAVEPAGEDDVYDITVPGPENWLADSVVSHNSGQIEQDADLVVFIYRDEYYNPETTDRPGEADLIIAKHRNGGLGEVPLVFQNEFVRFMNRSPDMA